MIDLLALEPTKISRDLKGKFMLIYGEAKAGKTTLLSLLPKCLILATEIGYNALADKYVQPIMRWTDFKSVVKQLKKPEVQEKFEFIGIDTADFLYEICEKYICAQNGVEKIADIPYGGGYALCKKEFSDTLREVAALGYGICFISHSTEKTFKNEKGEDYIKIVPALPNRPYDVVNKMVDVLGFLRSVKNYETGTTICRLFFRGDDRFLAGSRFKYMEPYIEYEYMEDGSVVYEKLANAFYNAIDKQAKASGTEVVTQQENLYKRSFADAMDEAKTLWIKLTEGNEDNAMKILDFVESTFGKRIKISEITEPDMPLLEVIIEEMKAM